MKVYKPVFQDHVSCNFCDGMFYILAHNQSDAENRVNRWLKKLDMKDKRYFTGCQFPRFYDALEMTLSEEGVLVT